MAQVNNYKDACSLADYHDRTGLLPEGMTAEQFDAIMTKYNLNAPDSTFFTLSNGKKIEVFEDTMKGMAGETMYFLQFADHNRNIITLKSISDLLSRKDHDAISRWQEALSDSNYDAAVAFCK